MSITSRRRAKLIGGALFAASLAAGSFATITPVSADIGDSGYSGYIRVTPTSSTVDWENQPAPTIMAGATSAAASVQLNIPSDWESGDKITLQVQSDNNIALDGQQTNCLSAAQSISFASPYVVADVAVSGAMMNPQAGWGSDTGAVDHNPGTDGSTYAGDPRTVDPNPSVAPTFNVALVTSPSCGGVGVTDQIELTFSNTATADGANPGFFELTFNNIRYTVGAAVTPGPVHVIPFARQAVDTAPGTFANDDLFGGNVYSSATALMWTNNAFISPVTIAATGTNLIADCSWQPLGSITLTELVGDALGNGVQRIYITGVDSLMGPMAVAVTGNAGGSGTVTAITGSYIEVTLAGMVSGTSGTVTISGINASDCSDGDITTTLSSVVSVLNWVSYLTPDDQNLLGDLNTDDSNELYTSDVNLGSEPSAYFAVSINVPARIGGNDRYETSAKIAYNLDLCQDWVVVVSGSSYPDALSAAYLAGALNWLYGSEEDEDFGTVPVLLVGTNSIPESVSAYMADVGAKNVYIVGGASAVSASVEATLRNTAATKCRWNTTIGSTAPVPNQKLSVVRVAGADRYATNRAAVNLGSDMFEENRNRVSLDILQPTKHTAIIATGSGFADALAAGPVAYDGLPLILTDGTSLSASAALALTDNDIAQVIIIGGTSAVSAAVEAQIAAMGITTGRVSGADRYATATAWANFMAAGCAAAPIAGAYDCGLGWGTHSGLLLASGTNFADALSGAPLGWDWGAPIILSDPTTLSANTQSWLVANRVALSWITVLGLGSAVSTSVMNAANAAIS